MKYIVVLGDGMADRPMDSLGGRTPLEVAHKPGMDFLARHGSVGMVRTIPEGMPPGSDTANLSVMGYAPRKYYSGRSPLEAVSMGVPLAEDDVTFRMNLVTLSDAPEFSEKTMVDYSAGEISTEESALLVRDLERRFGSADIHIHAGISYRHCFVMHHALTGTALTPPHDISGQKIGEYLPTGLYGRQLLSIMEAAHAFLKSHPVNLAREQKGLHPANAVWFWGEGTKPMLPDFEKTFGVKGGVICAVDLIKGIGGCAGMQTPFVPGATGGMRTDFAAKGRAALQLLDDGCDLVYIHVEAPDESGHHGDVRCKIDAIEAIDREILEFLMAELSARGEAYRILLTPDHPTPIAIRTHTPDPVPFVLYDSTRDASPCAETYSERSAQATGQFLEEGPMLMQRLISGNF